MGVVEGRVEEIVSNASVETPICQSLQNAWQEIADQQQASLDSITFEQLVNSIAESEHMYYI